MIYLVATLVTDYGCTGSIVDHTAAGHAHRPVGPAAAGTWAATVAAVETAAAGTWAGSAAASAEQRCAAGQPVPARPRDRAPTTGSGVKSPCGRSAALCSPARPN